MKRLCDKRRAIMNCLCHFISQYCHIFLILAILLIFFPVSNSQDLFVRTRQEAIMEYQKMRDNDSDLGVRVSGSLGDATIEEIEDAINNAWIRKKIMILLQLMDLWENPISYPRYMNNNDYIERLTELRQTYNINTDIGINEETVNILEDIYISSATGNSLPKLLRDNNIPYANAEIYIRVFKRELRVELFAREKNINNRYTFIKSYQVLNSVVSRLGPKTREGDCLTPEGIYRLIYGNCWRWSDFYLAFKISYPNRADRIRKGFWNLTGSIGGDINFHGCTASIGCIPIGNPSIEEVFILLTRNLGRNNIAVRIDIFPFDFSTNENRNLHEEYRERNQNLAEFWDGLKKIYEYFETNRTLPNYSIDDRTGYYRIR